jgi:hypothetical protein
VRRPAARRAELALGDRRRPGGAADPADHRDGRGGRDRGDQPRPVRRTGARHRPLPYLRLATALALTGLATALALTGLAIGVLQLAVTGASLNGGILALARNVLGLTGIGLATSLATGGLLAWTLPLGYLAFAQYAPHRPRRPRLATRPPRRAPTNSMKADPEPAQHNYTSAASSALTCAI